MFLDNFTRFHRKYFVKAVFSDLTCARCHTYFMHGTIIRLSSSFMSCMACYFMWCYAFRNSRPEAFCKKVVLRKMFFEFCEIFKNIFPYRTNSGGCFCALRNLRGRVPFFGISTLSYIFRNSQFQNRYSVKVSLSFWIFGIFCNFFFLHVFGFRSRWI